MQRESRHRRDHSGTAATTPDFDLEALATISPSTAEKNAFATAKSSASEVERKAGAAPPPEPAKLTGSNREVVELFVTRLRRRIAIEAAEAVELADAAAAAADEQPDDHAGADRRRGHHVEQARCAVARRLRELWRVLLP
jgi:hypothetical protein